MRYLSVLFCFWSGLSIADSELILHSTDQKHNNKGCASIVCNNVIKPESVSMAGDFPERSRNGTLSALGNVAFIAGEVR
ncbi:hypothetical protein [Aliivibrio sifiae]|uniref:hypothetical protein n=1 Tax=Aliivibrio sifiae TaxID=566293 RepID=UPI000CF4CC34|nr:hypothetical protein [Aliivibrio sifiae]